VQKDAIDGYTASRLFGSLLTSGLLICY